MKILFIGDIFGRAGREFVKKVLPEIKKEYSPDLIIANAENLTHGSGFTPEHIQEMQKAGINIFTTGNHVWKKQSGVTKLDDHSFPVIRPANYPGPKTPGRGYAIFKDGAGNKILVINLMGRVFMKNDFDCPFKAMDRILEETSNEKLSAIVVDFHAEATSEKYALGFYLDGKVSAVIGTHTHVPTSDAHILENGTAYISDVGMVGSFDSVIGVKKEIIIDKFLTQMPVKHEPEDKGKMIFSSVFVDIDDETKKALNVYHIQKIL